MLEEEHGGKGEGHVHVRDSAFSPPIKILQTISTAKSFNTYHQSSPEDVRTSSITLVRPGDKGQ
jgi:hypothetical protein